MNSASVPPSLESADQTFAADLRSALAAAEFGDWRWNAATDELAFSPCGAAIFGLSATQRITWTKLRELLHMEDREREKQLVEQALQSGERCDLEYRVSNSSGHFRWVFARGRAVYDSQGHLSGMVGIVHDITTRKQLEEEQTRLARELQNRLTEWQSLFDTAPIAIWLAHDPKCKRVTGNHYTNAILGVPFGTNISVTSDGQQRVPFEIWQDGRKISAEEFPLRLACFDGVPVRNCEQEVRTPDGRRVSVLVNAVPLYNEKHEIRGALATGLDITERKKTESALRESEERFRHMADASPALIWIAGPDKLCTWVNKGWINFVGKPMETQLGDGWISSLHPDDVKPALDTYLSAFETRSDFDLEYRLRRADGQYRWVLTKGRPLRDSGQEFKGFIGSCVDVTESKLRQDELEQLVAERTSQMSDTISHLETFSYTVSHDMRAPLRSMEGFASVLLEDYGSKLDEAGRDYLNRITHSARKLDLLIEHVLSYSRIATGKINLEDLDLGSVIEDVVTQSTQLRGELVDLSVSLKQRVAKGNEQMLFQIFANLLQNAAKYVSPGVRPVIRVTSEPFGTMVRIVVEDNGIGISPEHQERIFDVFSKLHSDQEYEGTGIGLAIVKKAVQMLGGEIGVESEPGQGSRFWFTLKT